MNGTNATPRAVPGRDLGTGSPTYSAARLALSPSKRFITGFNDIHAAPPHNRAFSSSLPPLRRVSLFDHMSMNQLEQLKQITTVVADTGDFESMRIYQPQDATTNPSLILQAAAKPEYRHLVEQAVTEQKSSGLTGHGTHRGDPRPHPDSLRPGNPQNRPRPRFHRGGCPSLLRYQATIAKARQLIAAYEKEGHSRDRILIKIASTWEGIKAAEVLEKEGIHCNLTLLFSFAQAVACAEAGVQLISPFVGRILDWYKASTGKDYQGEEDPGVQSVRAILQLLQEVRLQDRGHGRLVPQQG